MSGRPGVESPQQQQAVGAGLMGAGPGPAVGGPPSIGRGIPVVGNYEGPNNKRRRYWLCYYVYIFFNGVPQGSIFGSLAFPFSLCKITDLFSRQMFFFIFNLGWLFPSASSCVPNVDWGGGGTFLYHKPGPMLMQKHKSSMLAAKGQYQLRCILM